MLSGAVREPLWHLFASSNTVPYGVLAATVSIGIVLMGGLAAMALKGRTGLPSGPKRHPTPPLPDPVLGRAKRQAAIADPPADRLSVPGSGDSSEAGRAEPDSQTPAAQESGATAT
jgi:hypothetical protein